MRDVLDLTPPLAVGLVDVDLTFHDINKTLLPFCSQW
jgi:hypothetical protein